MIYDLENLVNPYSDTLSMAFEKGAAAALAEIEKAGIVIDIPPNASELRIPIVQGYRSFKVICIYDKEELPSD